VLSDADKAVYHAAAVFASNYVVTSVWAAMRLLEQVGVRNARQLLAPLVSSSVENVTSISPARAMTGPVARGDTETIGRHLAALRDADPTDGRIRDAYRSLARLAAALAGADASAIERATA
jgi:predicted short-subunit dehydrogenase-like oxidoreductase (DUF2520 family)